MSEEQEHKLVTTAIYLAVLIILGYGLLKMVNDLPVYDRNRIVQIYNTSEYRKFGVIILHNEISCHWDKRSAFTSLVIHLPHWQRPRRIIVVWDKDWSFTVTCKNW